MSDTRTKRVKVHLEHDLVFDSWAPLVVMGSDEWIPNDAPRVATFRNGPPPSTKRQDLAFELYENETKKQRLVLASSEKVVYQGANFGYVGSSHDFSSYAVGVYDKQTHTVRVCRVPQLYVMQQALKKASEPLEEDTRHGGEPTSVHDQRRELVNVFGSKKSRRMQTTRDANLVHVDYISGAASVTETFKQKIAAAQRTRENARALDGSASKAAAALAATRMALVPPCDMDAPTPDQVYDVCKFIDGAVMESLTLMAHEVLEELQTTSVAEYAARVNLASLPTRLLLALAAPYNVRKVCLIVYVTYLLEFTTVRFPLRKSAESVSDDKSIPLVIVRHFLDLFTDVTDGTHGARTYFQSKAKKDKLCLHLMVVALTISDFSVDLGALAHDLKKSVVQVQAYARQLGCVVEKVKAEATGYGEASKKHVHRAVLAVPLHLPLPKRRAASRR
ncbi:hypothetical protein PsorP6_010987 [Peronosclerospora sorghi]|uniref:Uncharacterized protein n=1 Tax=Peronosclerospora sorghi TaxID=230839 RepID=A0ACC0VW09_9STRA|nr:hypothetical protein PsorP6_010987 [Peronosclerospora sorghi]